MCPALGSLRLLRDPPQLTMERADLTSGRHRAEGRPRAGACPPNTEGNHTTTRPDTGPTGTPHRTPPHSHRSAPPPQVQGVPADSLQGVQHGRDHSRWAGLEWAGRGAGPIRRGVTMKSGVKADEQAMMGDRVQECGSRCGWCGGGASGRWAGPAEKGGASRGRSPEGAGPTPREGHEGRVDLGRPDGARPAPRAPCPSHSPRSGSPGPSPSARPCPGRS